VRDQAKVVGQWHGNRHTLVTELAESGAGGEAIVSIADHVSRAMLSRYSHVRMEAKRRALDGIATRQREAGEKRKKEAEQKQQAAADVAARGSKDGRLRRGCDGRWIGAHESVPAWLLKRRKRWPV
jgi:hypothetical protein